MDIQYRKVTPVKLGDVGKDERWLQERITEDPSILGLGDLTIIQRERVQPSGGRIDFLMYDPEDSARFEIEVMLGTLDESHIIRTIEYWDVERRRYPSLEHRAVIVAEDITNRFFNIIGMLNKAVPIIAVQLNAFTIDNTLMLNFVKVLDLVEPPDEEEEGTQEQVNRGYWESKSSAKSLEIMDKVVAMTAEKFPDPRVTYNRHHVALGTNGYNFCWFHPRKGAHLHLIMKTGADSRDATVEKMQDIGIECAAQGKRSIRLVLTLKELEENADLIRKTLAVSEEGSRR